MMLKKLFILLALTISVSASLERGLEIAKKMDAAAEGYVGEVSQMQLILIDSTGVQLTRDMLGESLELKDVDKTLMSFLTPLDVKGIKMLTWSHDKQSDDQWLFLPSLKRVKKINSNTRGSSFMGSEFSFEDLSGQSIDKYTFNFKGETKIDGKTVWIVERVSKESSSYGKVILYVSPEMLLSVKTEYFNKRDELLKVGVFTEFSTYNVKGKKLYRVGRVEMNNIQTKKKSIFLWKDRKIGVALSHTKFSKNNLK